MFLDEVEISIRAGKGGAGAVSFHREKYVTKGGPDGGHGGHGGNVLIRATANKNTLQHFKGVKVFAAQNGQGGAGRLCTGKSGEDLILEVPVGTLLLENGKLVADLVADGQTWLAARGGLGGKGNSNFCSSTRQLPRFAELGEPGEAKDLKLELKLLADVGIIGLPSVGKSTLISVISKAKPKIAAYHFTTLTPNLGVVEWRGENFVVSDMPGLIKGASRGKGLGHQFLKHVERVRFFWHLIDATSKTPATDYRTIRDELRKFNPTLAEKPEVLVFSKSDLVEPKELEKLRKKFDRESFVICAPIHSGVEELLNFSLEILAKTKPIVPKIDKEIPVFRPHLEQKSKAFLVKKKNKKTFLVDGPRLNQIVIMSDLTNSEAVARVQDVLNKLGVSRELSRAGAEPGATIEIAGKRFEWWG
ncbi:MAG: GTPase ObgE [Patescibacteria group bacterium]